jgi:hypothetical protein
MRKLALPLAAAASIISAGAFAQGMGPKEARHLLNRTGFDAQLREVDEFARLTRREGVERLLAGMHTEARTPSPAWAHRARHERG